MNPAQKRPVAAIDALLLPDASQRPGLHFTPRKGWINDPLGLTYHEGRYHLFFQFVPEQTAWATEQHWGHAMSDDLVHWRQTGIALSPGDGDDGVWSGSLVVPPEGPAAMFYTSARRPDAHRGVTRIARPTDDTWTTWRKGAEIAELPDVLDLIAVRDPYVLHDGTSWLMLLGAGLTDGTATALTYRSANLESWAYTGLLTSRHESETDPWTGPMWECPQLFRLDDRWVLLVSVWSPTGPHNEAYAIGELVDGRFIAEAWHRLTYGEMHYAGSVFTDTDGRPGLIHWLRGVADPGGQWAGAHSMAHALAIENGHLVARPHPALAGARTGPGLPARRSTVELPPIADLEWRLDAPEAVSALTLTGNDGQMLRLEASRGSLTSHVGSRTSDIPITGDALRVVIDGTIVEVFTEGGVMAATLPPADLISLTVTGDGTATAYPLG